MVVGSRSIWMDLLFWGTWKNLSIVPRVATGWWTRGRSDMTGSERWCDGKTVVGGVPTVQVEGWQVDGCGQWVVDDLVQDVFLLLDDVEKLSIR